MVLKRRFIFGLVLIMLFSMNAARAEGLSDVPVSAYIRLHVVAADDSAAAQALGYEGPVTARTGVFDFPDRHYGAVFVPAGQYRALRVVIGEGEGHNWWCVLYPSLCAPGAEGPVIYDWALLGWVMRLLGGGE